MKLVALHSVVRSTDVVADTFLGLPMTNLTPVALALAAISLIITSFARGWILSKFTVEQLLAVYVRLVDQANARADDYKSLWEVERARGDVQAKIIEELTVVGQIVNKILVALPPRHSQDSPESTHVEAGTTP